MKRTIKEIEARISGLKSNLYLIKDEKARARVQTELDTLVELKDKSEGEIRCKLSEEKTERNLTIKWILGHLI